MTRSFGCFPTLNERGFFRVRMLAFAARTSRVVLGGSSLAEFKRSDTRYPAKLDYELSVLSPSLFAAAAFVE